MQLLASSKRVLETFKTLPLSDNLKSLLIIALLFNGKSFYPDDDNDDVYKKLIKNISLEKLAKLMANCLNNKFEIIEGLFSNLPETDLKFISQVKENSLDLFIVKANNNTKWNLRDFENKLQGGGRFNPLVRDLKKYDYCHSGYFTDNSEIQSSFSEELFSTIAEEFMNKNYNEELKAKHSFVVFTIESCSDRNTNFAYIPYNYNDTNYITSSKDMDYLIFYVSFIQDDLYSKLKSFYQSLCTSFVSFVSFLKLHANSLLQGENLRFKADVFPQSFITDPKQGLWQCYIEDFDLVNKDIYFPLFTEDKVTARDPVKDLDPNPVTIDFGTSSTVVAYRNNLGEVNLLQIGKANKEQSNYENPTSIEFSDYEGFKQAWQNEPWRPLTLWEQVKSSFQAKNELSEKAGALRGLTDLKTWARHSGENAVLRLQDEKGVKFEITEPLFAEDFYDLEKYYADTQINPIEIYAYYIGLFLNSQWRSGGTIFTNYNLTFPVKFDKATKDRIYKSFYQGLLRSLPSNLIYTKYWQEKTPFKLNVVANEPSALAASVLPKIGLNATQEGVSFAIFDFGGGTTDFAFGVYRLPTEEEEDNEGWDNVVEVYDVSGDENLGGEHLLELLAFSVINDNLEDFKNNDEKIFFECPIFLKPKEGTESIFINTGNAHVNLTLLKEKLRPLWENGSLETDGTGQISFFFYTENNTERSYLWTIDEEKLKTLLLSRIQEGVNKFFISLGQAFKRQSKLPENVNIILTGNSCKSPLVKQAFETFKEKLHSSSGLNEDSELGYTIREDLIPKEDQESKADFGLVTLKTGVALGLLQLLPGERTGFLISYNKEANQSEQAPFMYHVGIFKHGMLQSKLNSKVSYGQWVQISKIFNSGVIILGYTQDPNAIENMVKEEGCPRVKLDLGVENAKKFLFAKASDPKSISYVIASSLEEIDDAQAITLTFSDN